MLTIKLSQKYLVMPNSSNNFKKIVLAKNKQFAIFHVSSDATETLSGT